jgi:DNA-binding NtrC family response regulator
MVESWDVLVIDDEPVVRDAVGRVLAEEGLRVATAVDGASGLAHPAVATCRLVLLDLILPDRSGIEVLRALQAARPRLPVVVITGYATHESTRRAFEAGAIDYLPKPFEASELLAVVCRALGDRDGPPKERHP